MATREHYEGMIREHGWKELRALWENIKKQETPGWDQGKAFE
jgi:hypothetical protein